MPGDTLYIKNLQIETNSSASSNGFSSTGYGNLSYDGSEILGTVGIVNWSRNGSNIYYDGGNVGIQNTNPQHALSVGNSSNLFFDKTTNELHVANSGVIICKSRQDQTAPIGSIVLEGNASSQYAVITARGINGSALYLQNQNQLGATIYSDSSSQSVNYYSSFNKHVFGSNQNVGIQNTNPQHALTIGSPSNVYVDTVNSRMIVNADLIVNNGSITGQGGGISHINASNLTTGTIPNGKLSGDYTNVGSLTLASTKNIKVPFGQLVIGKSSVNELLTAVIDIKTDDSNFINNFYTAGNPQVLLKSLNPAIMISTSNIGSFGLSWSIGINTHGGPHNGESGYNQPFLFNTAGINATSNCLYFIPNGSQFQNYINGTTQLTQGGFIRIFGDVPPERYTGGTQMNFTGQHRCKSENIDLYSNIYIGYIVGSNGSYSMIGSTVKNTSNNIHINESLPYVSLTNSEKQSNVFGVISNIEDQNDGNRITTHGVWGSALPKPLGDTRVIVNSLGEGAIWVSNVNGALINGDYITTSSIPGLGMKQDGTQLMNYTVAKITMDCDFNPVDEPILVARKQMVEIKYEKYETTTYTSTKTMVVFDPETDRWVQKEEIITQSKKEQVFEEFDLYNEEGEVIGKHTIPVYETGMQENNSLDENGQLVFDDSGQTQPAYLVKYVDSNGTILDSEQPGCYKMAFVGCTYHCG